MNKLRQLLALALVAAVISLGFAGCKKNDEEHPKGDDTTTEHPSEEAEPNQTAAEEHPAGEHPTGEHPK